MSMSSIVELDLSGNRLEGQVRVKYRNSNHDWAMWQIPNNLLNLFPTFGVLKLQANQFTGPVPVPSSYRYFGVLDLSYNSLSGNIPKNFVDNIAVRNYSRLFCA